MNKSNRLPALLAEVSALHRDAQGYQTKAAEKALAAGAALCEAKELCQHGEWAGRLAETGIPERTAQRYMTLHRAGAKSATVALFGLARSERIAALGLRLWPKDGWGCRSTGLDHESGLHMLAVTWAEDEGRASYRAFYTWPDPELDFTVAMSCTAPFGLGVLHDGRDHLFHGGFTLGPLPPPETAAMAQRFGGAT